MILQALFIVSRPVLKDNAQRCGARTNKTNAARDTGAFTFTGVKYMPKGLPSFLNEPEPPDIDHTPKGSLRLPVRLSTSLLVGHKSGENRKKKKANQMWSDKSGGVVDIGTTRVASQSTGCIGDFFSRSQPLAF